MKSVKTKDFMWTALIGGALYFLIVKGYDKRVTQLYHRYV